MKLGWAISLSALAAVAADAADAARANDATAEQTTGANWAGPIGDFQLTVDKGAPDNLISFCADGVKKISPTRFEVRQDNFVPRRDLNILILYRPRT